MSGERVRLYGVTDLDGVWTNAPQAVVDYGVKVLHRSITMVDYHDLNEHIPSLWGLADDPQTARDHWHAFCTEWMPRMSLVKGAEQTIHALNLTRGILERAGVDLVIDIWTSRRSDYRVITERWLRTHIDFVGALRHSINWALPEAHKHSKADHTGELPHKPAFYIEDEPKHAIPAAKMWPDCKVILFGDSKKNLEAAAPGNVVKITNHTNLANYFIEMADNFAEIYNKTPAAFGDSGFSR